MQIKIAWHNLYSRISNEVYYIVHRPVFENTLNVTTIKNNYKTVTDNWITGSIAITFVFNKMQYLIV